MLEARDALLKLGAFGFGHRRDLLVARRPHLIDSCKIGIGLLELPSRPGQWLKLGIVLRLTNEDLARYPPSELRFDDGKALEDAIESVRGNSIHGRASKACREKWRVDTDPLGGPTSGSRRAQGNFRRIYPGSGSGYSGTPR